MAGHQLVWRSASAGSFFSSGSNDTGIGRQSAGILKINDGSTGSGSLYAGGSASNYFEGSVGVGIVAPPQTTGQWHTSRRTVSGCLGHNRMYRRGQDPSELLFFAPIQRKYSSSRPGLDEVLKMRSVEFKWKNRDEQDLGFIAEEINEVSPSLIISKKVKSRASSMGRSPRYL